MRQRKNLRVKLFEAQDEVDERKENVIGEIEQRLAQRVSEDVLFEVRWVVV